MLNLLVLASFCLGPLLARPFRVFEAGFLEDRHPLPSAPETLDHQGTSFALRHVLAYHTTKKEIHRFDHASRRRSEVAYVPADYNGTSLSADPITYRDRLRLALLAMENSYPPDDITQKSGEELAERVKFHNLFYDDLKQAGFAGAGYTVDDIRGFQAGFVNFFGTPSNGSGTDYSFGPLIVVYVSVNPNISNALFVMRGMSTDLDSKLLNLWIFRSIDRYFEEESLRHWELIGNDPADLPSTNDFVNALFRLGGEILASGYRSELEDELLQATYNQDPTLSVDAVAEEGTFYFGLARDMFEHILPMYNTTHNITLSGHSFGGFMTQLISVYYAQKGVIYETILFAPVGSRCIPTYEEWTGDNFLDPLNSWPHIRAYANPYDASVLLGWSWGELCLTPAQDDDRSVCEEIFGQGLNIGLTLADAFSLCRQYTHGITNLFLFLRDDSIVNADGSLNTSCYQWDTNANAKNCPSVGPSGTFIGVMFFLLVVISLLLFLLVWSIMACVRRCQHSEPACCFWPCCRCCSGIV